MTARINTQMLVPLLITGVLLSLLWGLVLPEFLVLDALASQASRAWGLGAGVSVLILSTALARWRLRRPLSIGLAVSAALDVAWTSTVVAIVGWMIIQRDPRLPYVESFSILCLQAASGLAAALGVYLAVRRQLRRAQDVVTPMGLPGIRSVFATAAGVVGLLASVTLGIGALGRSAGNLDRVFAARLSEQVDLLAQALRLSDGDDHAHRILMSLPSQDPFTTAEFLPRFEFPERVERARAQGLFSDEGDHIVLLDGGTRWRAVHRPAGSGVLWLISATNVRPPVQAPDEATSILILALLVFGAPLAAGLIATDLRDDLVVAARSLSAMGPDQGADSSIWVPITTHDEIGDLAEALNAACGRFVTENSRLALDLNAAAQQDRARSRFLTAASHELRTPLNSIIGYCHLLLQDDEMSTAQHEDIQVIADASDQLLTHVNEILDLSHLESGLQHPLMLESIDLLALAQQVVAARSVGLPDDLHLSVGGEALSITGDRQRIRQVLENLIGNAIKFSQTGEVLVSLAAGTLDEAAAAHLQITDDGPGIPAANLQAIFTEYYRVDARTEVVGTGLGLAIARQLVERHGGKIWAESEVGYGSVFHVLLPVEEA